MGIHPLDIGHRPDPLLGIDSVAIGGIERAIRHKIECYRSSFYLRYINTPAIDGQRLSKG